MSTPETFPNDLPAASWAALGLDAAMSDPETARRPSTPAELRIKANAARRIADGSPLTNGDAK